MMYTCPDQYDDEKHGNEKITNSNTFTSATIVFGAFIKCFKTIFDELSLDSFTLTREALVVERDFKKN